MGTLRKTFDEHSAFEHRASREDRNTFAQAVSPVLEKLQDAIRLDGDMEARFTVGPVYGTKFKDTDPLYYMRDIDLVLTDKTGDRTLGAATFKMDQRYPHLAVAGRENRVFDFSTWDGHVDWRDFLYTLLREAARSTPKAKSPLRVPAVAAKS